MYWYVSMCLSLWGEFTRHFANKDLPDSSQNCLGEEAGDEAPNIEVGKLLSPLWLASRRVECDLLEDKDVY